MQATGWAYAYARICSYQSRSWTGARAARLAGPGRLGELWREVFREEPPPSLSPASIERHLEAKAGKYFLRIAGKDIANQPFFRALLSKAEFSLVKRVISSLRSSRSEASLESPTDWGADTLPVGLSFNLAAYPDLPDMFRRTRFAWIAEQGFDDLAAAKNRLDRQYYRELSEALRFVPLGRRGSLARQVSTDIEIENLVWALRLRRYYAMGRDEIAPLLIGMERGEKRSTALAALALRPDVRADWAGWRYEALLNEPPSAGEAWYFDVRSFERALRRRRYAELRRSLHLEPSTWTPLYCLFRLEEYETASVTAVVEGLQMEAPSDEISDFLGELAEVES